MSVSDWFQTFCDNLRMKATDVSNIQYRYKQITRRINLDYWNSDSEINHSLYVGSYGRDTEIHLSDIDMIVQLPYETYKKFNNYSGNGQSALLQEVKGVLQKTYNTSDAKGDGQVVVINFTDGICFEIVPGFINDDKSYTYPDTNNGGSWKSTNPRKEIEAMNDLNKLTNKNLKRLCRMIRAWKDKWDVPMSGILIDTLAYNFIKDWDNKDKSYLYYDFMTRDFFEFLTSQDNSTYYLAPGSNSKVYINGNFKSKATSSLETVKIAIKNENDYPNTAKSKWREIYGSKFPN